MTATIVTTARRGVSMVVVAACCACGGAVAQVKDAANFPVKPLRIVVPYPPGGGLDIMARLLAGPLNERWGQPVIIDNRPGASGMVGTQIVSRAVADGYTLVMVSTEFITAPLVYRQRLYDTIADFTGVGQTASQSYLLVVHPSVPAHSVKELIAHAKSRATPLTYTSAGLGGVGHLSGELFKRHAGIDMTFVPYKGTGPALTETIGGQVQVMIINPLPAIAHIKAGRLRLLAGTDAKRIASLPDTPAMNETLPGLATSGWNGVIAPKGVPAAVIARLNEAISAIIKSPDGRERIITGGAEPVTSTPQAFNALMADEHRRWSEIIRVAKIGG
jgi:tripartite-type tricarboxylate transporter receptor subunit TctC